MGDIQKALYSSKNHIAYVRSTWLVAGQKKSRTSQRGIEKAKYIHKIAGLTRFHFCWSLYQVHVYITALYLLR